MATERNTSSRMTVAIMQPYFFPYMGYFQLLNSVDMFVVYDDVQYMKGGWVNRNRILCDGSPKWLTYPVQRRPHETLISEMRYVAAPTARDNMVNAVSESYRKAPYFEAHIGPVADLLRQDERSLSLYNEGVLRELTSMMGIGCEFVRSSELAAGRDRRGQDRVLEICKALGASRYINPIGGMNLYEREAFGDAGIDLKFLRMKDVVYQQFGDPFVPDLSIIDVMFFNTVEQASGFLDHCELV